MGANMDACLAKIRDGYSVYAFEDLRAIAENYSLPLRETKGEQIETLADAIFNMVIYLPDMVDAMHADGYDPPLAHPPEPLSHAQGVAGDVQPSVVGKWD